MDITQCKRFQLIENVCEFHFIWFELTLCKGFAEYYDICKIVYILICRMDRKKSRSAPMRNKSEMVYQVPR